METHNSYELMHKVVYAEKKLHKQQLRDVDVAAIVEESQQGSLTLKRLSVVVLGLAKVLNKRFRALLEDCMSLLSLLSARKAPRIPPSRNITLQIEDGMFIEDEMVDLPDVEFPGDAFESMAMDALDVGFEEIPSIEQARDSTLVASTVQADSLLGGIKRRRMIVDRMTEIAEGVFRGNLRSVADILMRQAHETGVEPKIHVDAKIAKVFESGEEVRSHIEEHRMSAEFEMGMPDFTFNPVEMESHKAEADETAVEPAMASAFDISMLPTVFSFNEVVKGLSVYERAASFMCLLTELTRGTAVAGQNEPFGSIECRLVR